MPLILLWLKFWSLLNTLQSQISPEETVKCTAELLRPRYGHGMFFINNQSPNFISGLTEFDILQLGWHYCEIIMEILCFQFDNTAQIFNGNFKSQTVKYEMGSSRGERAGTWIGHPFTKYKQNVSRKWNFISPT